MVRPSSRSNEHSRMKMDDQTIDNRIIGQQKCWELIPVAMEQFGSTSIGSEVQFH